MEETGTGNEDSGSKSCMRPGHEERTEAERSLRELETKIDLSKDQTGKFSEEAGLFGVNKRWEHYGFHKKTKQR